MWAIPSSFPKIEFWNHIFFFFRIRGLKMLDPFYQMKPVVYTSVFQRQSSSGWVVCGALASFSYLFSAPFLVITWGTLMQSRKIFFFPNLLSSALLYWSLKTRDIAATLGQMEGRRRKMGKGFMFSKYFKCTECFMWGKWHYSYYREIKWLHKANPRSVLTLKHDHFMSLLEYVITSAELVASDFI